MLWTMTWPSLSTLLTLGTAAAADEPLSSGGRRHLQESLTTTELIIVVVCSVLGALLIVAVVLLCVLSMRSQATVVPASDAQMLRAVAQSAALSKSASAAAPSTAVDSYLTYPHPLLMQRQIQAELILQQQNALRGRGPNVDALQLAKQLMYAGQLQAAQAVAYNAGVLHLLPGLQQQLAAAGYEMTPPHAVYTTPVPPSARQEMLQYNSVFAQPVVASQQYGVQQQQYSNPLQQMQMQYGVQQQYNNPLQEQPYAAVPQQQYSGNVLQQQYSSNLPQQQYSNVPQQQYNSNVPEQQQYSNGAPHQHFANDEQHGGQQQQQQQHVGSVGSDGPAAPLRQDSGVSQQHHAGAVVQAAASGAPAPLHGAAGGAAPLAHAAHDAHGPVGAAVPA